MDTLLKKSMEIQQVGLPIKQLQLNIFILKMVKQRNLVPSIKIQKTVT
nr:hypothetical protein [Enterococcus crotali]